MTNDDLPVAVGLSESVGWPHTTNDWSVALQIGHGTLATDGDEVVGVMLWWPQGSKHATLGLAIVPEAHQRRGIGRLLIDETLRQAGDRAVSLCGTAEGLRLYERVGFVAHGLVHQFQGIASPSMKSEIDSSLVDAVDLADLVRLDTAVDGRNRSDLLRAIHADAEVLGLEQDGVLVGWAMCRPFGRGHVIGPVVATSVTDAAQLAEPFLRRHAGSFVRLDTPTDSGLSTLLASHGLEQVGEVVAMTRGPSPSSGGPARRFALASQAFG